MRRKAVGVLFAGLVCALLSSPARATCAALPYTLTNGQTADAAQVMADLNALLSCINSGAGTPAGSTNAVQYNAGSGSFGGVGPLTNGQLVIGSTGNAPQAATLTAGSGIAVTNAAGSITVATTAPSPASGLFNQVLSSTPTSAGTGLTTWLNQGTASIADTAVGVAITAPSSSGDQLRVRYKAAPATPYKFTALIASTALGVNNTLIGLGWYDGSSKLHVIDLVYNNGWNVEVTKWNSTSSFSAADAAGTPIVMNPLWVQIQDDGTNVYFRFSADGTSFKTLFSVAKASGWLGSSGYSNVIFFTDAKNTDTIGTLMSWAQG